MVAIANYARKKMLPLVENAPLLPVGWMAASRLLAFENGRGCTGGNVGLTHHQMNVECALRLAAASNRRLVLPPVHEPRIHTGCGDIPTVRHVTQWEHLIDTEGQPIATRAESEWYNGLAASRWKTGRDGRVGSGGGVLVVPLTPSNATATPQIRHTRRVLQLLNGSAPAVQLTLGKWAQVCNF